MKIKKSLIIAAALITGLSSFAQKKAAKVRIITIAGIVVDAGTMHPIYNAEIDDAKGHRFGNTDKKGYYNIAFEYREIGELKFNLQVKTAGYKTFTQKEHWGDLPDGINGFFYFGLQKKGSATKAFSVLGKNTMDKKALAYTPVLQGFKQVQDGKAFENDLDKAKHGNDDVVVQVNGKYYVVDNTGWIALGSDKDMVSIDNKRLVAADELNSAIKRKKVKSMTTVDATDHKVAIYTGNFKPAKRK